MRNQIRNILLVLVLLLTGNAVVAQDAAQEAERIVAVGDVHGDFENFVLVLEQAGIINSRGNWDAGATHLVQLGDLPDRGPDTGEAIELLMKLERQARRRGGQVHALIGNHEAMNMLGDLRYVHPGEYEAFVDRNSERLRERYYDAVVRQLRNADPLFEATPEHRARWNEQFPLGYVEHRLAWAPEGEIGSWVLQHDAVLRLDRTLFLHGGISPSVLGTSLDAINESIRKELVLGESAPPEPAGLATTEDGPLWYRGLATNDETTEAAHVDAILKFYDVDRIVIGHTPGLGTIVPRFDGRVLVIDSGISSYYGGHLTSLTISGERLVNIQGGEHLDIPVGGADTIPYFEAVLELEPDLQALRQYLESLGETHAEVAH